VFHLGVKLVAELGSTHRWKATPEVYGENKFDSVDHGKALNFRLSTQDFLNPSRQPKHYLRRRNHTTGSCEGTTGARSNGDVNYQRKKTMTLHVSSSNRQNDQPQHLLAA